MPTQQAIEGYRYFGRGYYNEEDDSGPYALDSDGSMHLMSATTEGVELEGEFRLFPAGYMHYETGCGPYALDSSGKYHLIGSYGGDSVTYTWSTIPGRPPVVADGSTKEQAREKIDAANVIHTHETNDIIGLNTFMWNVAERIQEINTRLDLMQEEIDKHDHGTPDIGTVGSYGFLQRAQANTPTSIMLGDIVSGADMRWSASYQYAAMYLPAPEGRWKCCGQVNSYGQVSTLFMRVE